MKCRKNGDQKYIIYRMAVAQGQILQIWFVNQQSRILSPPLFRNLNPTQTQTWNTGSSQPSKSVPKERRPRFGFATTVTPVTNSNNGTECADRAQKKTQEQKSAFLRKRGCFGCFEVGHMRFPKETYLCVHSNIPQSCISIKKKWLKNNYIKRLKPKRHLVTNSLIRWMVFNSQETGPHAVKTIQWAAWKRHTGSLWFNSRSFCYCRSNVFFV